MAPNESTQMDYPRPSWRPFRTELPVWFVDRMSYYTDRRKSFIVYEHGTTVFDASLPDADIIKCNASLHNIVTGSSVFSVTPMKDGNFLVTFTATVFGLVDGNFVARHKDSLTRDALTIGLFPNEAIVPPDADAVKVGHHVIGLYARANLYLDAESKRAIARLKPA
jgi:hypothetical protein